MLQNFQQIILPGLLTNMSRDDPSTLSVLNSLNTMVNETYDLKDISARLEVSLRNIMFGAKVRHSLLFII